MVLGGVEARRQVAIRLRLKLLPRALAVERALPLRGWRAVRRVIIVRHVVEVVVLHIAADIRMNVEAVARQMGSSRRRASLKDHKRAGVSSDQTRTLE